MRRTAVCLVLVAASSAAADPITVMVGVGMRAHYRSQTPGEMINGFQLPDEPAHDDLAPAVSLALGYRLPIEGHFGVAVGVRAGFSRMTWEHRAYGSRGYDWADVTRRYPLDLAITAQLTRERWSLAPWIGMQQTRVTETSYDVPVGEPTPTTGGSENKSIDTRDAALGLTVGYDVFRTRGGNVGLALDAQAGSNYAALGLGIAYRR